MTVLLRLLDRVVSSPLEAQMIKDELPIVVPVNIDGFRKAFDKTGLKIKHKNQPLSITFYKPKTFNNASSLEEIYEFLEKVTRES